MAFMRWLRSRLKQSSCVALFAMALQFALSFGHMHLEHVSAASKQTSVHRLGVAATVAALGSDELPGGAGDECAVCALIALANSLILPLPTSLPLATHFVVAQHAPTLDFYVAQTTLRPFQARGPPLV